MSMKTIKTSVVSLFAALILFSSCGSFGEGLLAGLSGMGGYGSFGGYGGASSFSGGSGNMDYLLDPNYAIAQTVAQNQQMNQVGQEKINQTKRKMNANGGRATNVSGSSSGNMGSYSSSGGGSSSSSSRVCRKLSATDLAHCNGNGKCPKCNGSKKYFDISYGVSKWVDPCGICNGSGKCPSCHGTGSR